MRYILVPLLPLPLYLKKRRQSAVPGTKHHQCCCCQVFLRNLRKACHVQCSLRDMGRTACPSQDSTDCCIREKRLPLPLLLHTTSQLQLYTVLIHPNFCFFPMKNYRCAPSLYCCCCCRCFQLQRKGNFSDRRSFDFSLCLCWPSPLKLLPAFCPFPKKWLGWAAGDRQHLHVA